MREGGHTDLWGLPWPVKCTGTEADGGEDVSLGDSDELPHALLSKVRRDVLQHLEKQTVRSPLLSSQEEDRRRGKGHAGKEIVCGGESQRKARAALQNAW